MSDQHDLDPARRRLLYRCWHRGTRELDLLLGRYADRHIASMDAGEIAGLESLLEVEERELFAWLTGTMSGPPELEADLLPRIRRFHADNPVAAG